jgi:hypothetical protein
LNIPLVFREQISTEHSILNSSKIVYLKAFWMGTPVPLGEVVLFLKRGRHKKV